MRNYKVIVEAEIELTDEEAQNTKINLELITQKSYLKENVPNKVTKINVLEITNEQS